MGVLRSVGAECAACHDEDGGFHCDIQGTYGGQAFGVIVLPASQRLQGDDGERFLGCSALRLKVLRARDDQPRLAVVSEVRPSLAGRLVSRHVFYSLGLH
jgi:hypothetical protein